MLTGITDSGSTYTELNGEVSSQILGPGDKIKAYIYPSDIGGSDIHNLDVTCPGVTLGSSTISNSGTGETGNPSVDDTTDEDGNDTWELVYTIPALGSNSNANGYFGFNVTLEDEAGNQSSTTNMTPPTTGLTITVDTVAPALESGGTPSLDPAVQTNGTDIKLYFTESLQTAANAGALDTGFSITGSTLGTVSAPLRSKCMDGYIRSSHTTRKQRSYNIIWVWNYR